MEMEKIDEKAASSDQVTVKYSLNFIRTFLMLEIISCIKNILDLKILKIKKRNLTFFFSDKNLI